MPKPRRSIVKERRFERELREFFADAIEADEFVEGAEFLLALEPEAGLQLAPGSRMWFLPMAPIGDLQVALYYTFDAQTVNFISICEV